MLLKKPARRVMLFWACLTDTLMMLLTTSNKVTHVITQVRNVSQMTAFDTVAGLFEPQELPTSF